MTEILGFAKPLLLVLVLVVFLIAFAWLLDHL